MILIDLDLIIGSYGRTMCVSHQRPKTSLMDRTVHYFKISEVRFNSQSETGVLVDKNLKRLGLTWVRFNLRQVS